jgi:hypothetical protein
MKKKTDFNITTLSVCPHFQLEIGRHIFMKLRMNIMGFETNLIPYFPFPTRNHINMAGVQISEVRVGKGNNMAIMQKFL